MNRRLIIFGFAAYATLCPTPAQAIIMRMIFETSAGPNSSTGTITGTQSATASNNGTVGEFATSDAMVVKAKPKLVSGLSGPTDPGDMAGIAVSGNDLFVVTNIAKGMIGEFNATTGAPIPPNPTGTLVSTGLSHPMGIAVEGDDLFVVNRFKGMGTIGEFNATTGAPIPPNPTGTLVSKGLHDPIGIAVEEGKLFVANHTGTIAEYDATTGMRLGTVNTTLRSLEGIAVEGGHLFVVDHGGTIKEYTTSLTLEGQINTMLKGLIGIAADQGDVFVVDKPLGKIFGFDATTGERIGIGPLIKRLNGPTGIAVVPVPVSVPDTSSTWALLLISLAAVIGLKPLLRRPA
jgi:outer membrane protein assembly factor BamB